MKQVRKTRRKTGARRGNRWNLKVDEKEQSQRRQGAPRGPRKQSDSSGQEGDLLRRGVRRPGDRVISRTTGLGGTCKNAKTKGSSERKASGSSSNTFSKDAKKSQNQVGEGGISCGVRSKKEEARDKRKMELQHLHGR